MLVFSVLLGIGILLMWYGFFFFPLFIYVFFSVFSQFEVSGFSFVFLFVCGMLFFFLFFWGVWGFSYFSLFFSCFGTVSSFSFYGGFLIFLFLEIFFVNLMGLLPFGFRVSSQL